MTSRSPPASLIVIIIVRLEKNYDNKFGILWLEGIGRIEEDKAHLSQLLVKEDPDPPLGKMDAAP